MQALRSPFGVFFVFCLASLAPMPGNAKGATVQVSISGPGMQAPIHTTDPAAIAPNAWGGNFALLDAGPVPEPDRNLPRYQIHLWVDLGDSVEVKYSVLLVTEPSSGKAFAYLPGPHDRWYANNVYTIIRGSEGRWFRANERWAKAIHEIIRRQRQP